MNPLVVPALTLVLLTGSPVQASPSGNEQITQDDTSQKHQQQGGGKPEGGEKGAAPGGGHPQGAAPGGGQPKGAAPGGGQPQGAAPGGGHPKGVAPGGGQPKGAAPGGGHAHGTAPSGGQSERYVGPHGYTPGQRPTNWNNGPRQFDPRDYHHNYQAEHRYHWNTYQRPAGWYERRWVFGENLPPIFWARNYWIADFWMFGLAIPPYGCTWVRYGDDALLIDAASGQILQVVYGIFD